ncbi:MAG: leucine-rich repeat domain-containing protein [Spirochaetaceae bacterium]|nr:leucine-rich repeat domain-containing protein [Spirochaetaceae bacterium]
MCAAEYDTALMDQLTAVSGGTDADNPVTVKLPPMTFTTGRFASADVVPWSAVNTAVLNAKKYVILDLSDCTAEKNTITGKLSPSGNDMNIIRDNEYLKGIILPSTLGNISAWAFDKCVNLTEITLSNNVIYIGNYAFNNCNNLINITIPISVTSIGGNAFYNNTNLTTVTFESAGIEVGNDAFNQDSDHPYRNGLNALYKSKGAGIYTRVSGQDKWQR